MIQTIAVLGAGNAGITAAAHLALRGYRVRLASRSNERLGPIREQGFIELMGVAGEGKARLESVTSDLREAVEGADLVMLSVAGPGIEHYARSLATLLVPHQIVFLNPGQCGGALEFHHALRRSGFSGELNVGESNTLTYGCRVVGPAKAWAYVLVAKVMFSALPARNTEAILQMLRPIYPALEPAPNVLYTSMHYLNGILHPPGMVCNAGWIEHTHGKFRYYFEGTTPAVARIIEQVDHERMEILTSLGLKGRSFIDMFFEHGYTTRDAWETRSVYSAFQSSEPNKPRQAPETLHHRYMEEDVPFGLVPMAEFAALAGVVVPTVDALITLGSVLMQTDYRAKGRNAMRMGIVGKHLPEILRWTVEGSD